MTLSAFILDSIHIKNITSNKYLPWLIQPLKQTSYFDEKESIKRMYPEEKQVCLHNSSCDKYVLKVSFSKFKRHVFHLLIIANQFIRINQGLRTYLSISLGLETAKFILSNLHLFGRSPIGILERYVKGLNYKFIGFVTGYPVIYRVEFILK